MVIYMTSKTTVAVNQAIRKKLKKLAGILDISQGEVIEQALKLFEKSVIKKFNEENAIDQDVSDLDVKKVLEAARKKVWAQDPECKAIQKRLESGSETIDDFIIAQWNSGLL